MLFQSWLASKEQLYLFICIWIVVPHNRRDLIITLEVFASLLFKFLGGSLTFYCNSYYLIYYIVASHMYI